MFGVSQEDKDVESAGQFLKHFDDRMPPFAILADCNREKTARLDPTTIYLVDREGVVREIFPATVRERPAWDAVLRRLDELED